MSIHWHNFRRVADGLRVCRTCGEAQEWRLGQWLYIHPNAVTASVVRPQRSRPESREGIVEAYDWNGQYLGCMGIERWRDLLADAVAQPQRSESGGDPE